jgi:hypothetical protein
MFNPNKVIKNMVVSATKDTTRLFKEIDEKINKLDDKLNKIIEILENFKK